jgi:hypothetical protein
MSSPQQSWEVLLWWGTLSSVAVINIVLWYRAARPDATAPDAAWWKRQRALSTVFVFGCAFRSWLPRADVQRICLYDSWLSSVLVGRSVATLAELSLMTQLALHLHRLASRYDVRSATALSQLIVPLIFVAEICSWYATLTKNYLGNACEESLWATSAGLAIVCYALVRWQRSDLRQRRELTVMVIAGAGYLTFMLLVDIPMYVHRWQADEVARQVYLAPLDGLRDLAHTWVITRRFEDWRSEMPWMGLYFSIAVWISIALATPPGAGAALNANETASRLGRVEREGRSITIQ